MRVESAEYLQGYMLALLFSDGTKRTVDFAPFLNASRNPLIREYLEPARFKRFNLTNGSLEWDNYDLCFPIIDLYNNGLMPSKKKGEG